MKGWAVCLLAVLGSFGLSETTVGQTDDIRVRIQSHTCAADHDGTLAEFGYKHCLQDSRFSVSTARIYRPGGAARRRGLRAGAHGYWWHTDSTIAFRMYDPGNVETMVKVLDGRAVNGHWWLDVAVMSDLYMRTAVFPNDSTPTDPGPGDGWWIETGTWKDLFNIDWGADVLWHCAYPFKYQAWETGPRLRRRACVISGAGTGLSLRDAWNADGSIPKKYYPEAEYTD